MKFESISLNAGNTVPEKGYRVTAQTGIAETLRVACQTGNRFLFVEDDDGNPIGIVDSEELKRRLKESCDRDDAKWTEIPVETVLQSRIDVPFTTSVSNQAEDFTRADLNNQMVGLISPEDIFVSWRSVQKTLKASQGDAVTGLPNRRSFDQHLRAEMNRGQRAGHSVAVVLIDLDHFKQINDQYGHAAGDSALQTVASTVRRVLRSYDHVARFGGDELAVICSGCRPGEIDLVIRRLRNAVSQLHEDPSIPRPVPTISVGAAVVYNLSRSHDGANVVAQADRCLYTAKSNGRNCAWKCESSGTSEGVPIFVPDYIVPAAPKTRFLHSSQVKR